MKRLVCLALLTACTTTRQAEAPATQPTTATAPAKPSSLYVFEGVEVIGSRKVPKEKLLELLTLPAAGSTIDIEKNELIPMLIESKKRLTSTYSFALARMSVVEYPPTHTIRVTLDLVDTGDEWRMPFSPEPQGDLPDPEGLIAAWKDYQKTFWKLRKEGAVAEWGVGTCRAPIVCHGGFDHPELAPLEQRFVDGVPRNVDALVRVAREDRDSGKRTTALMLLTYLPSPEQAAQAVLPSVRDPDTGVRNEALRLLGAAQHKSPERVITPLEPVLEALWFPLVTDRNKAGWALVRIVETEGAVHRQQILDKAGEMLLEMAGMRQKTDHEPARKVLAILAGQDFGDDLSAWRRWVEQERGSR